MVTSEQKCEPGQPHGKLGGECSWQDLRLCGEKRTTEPGLASQKTLVFPGKKMTTRGPKTGRVSEGLQMDRWPRG